MHTRDYVKEVFSNDGFYRLNDPEMVEFLKTIDDSPENCWPEFILSFRKRYYNLYDRVVLALLKGKDKLVRTILLRALNPKNKKEFSTFKTFIAGADPQVDAAELLEVAKHHEPNLTKELLKIKNLPQMVLSEIDDAAKVEASKPLPTPTPKTRPSKRASSKRSRVTRRRPAKSE